MQPVRPLDFGTLRLCLVKSETLFCATFEDRPCPFPMQNTYVWGQDSTTENGRPRERETSCYRKMSRSTVHCILTPHKGNCEKSCSSSTKDARQQIRRYPSFLLIPKTTRNYRPSVRFDNQLLTFTRLCHLPPNPIVTYQAVCVPKECYHHQ
jgi:hypothetical protein